MPFGEKDSQQIRRQEIISICSHFSEGNELREEKEKGGKEGGEGLSEKVRFRLRPKG